MSLKIGDTAPDFSLPDQNNKIHKLSHYFGEYVLIYFYPRDNTPGCTTEACAIRDNFNNFEKYNTVVLGISTDSVSSHDKFQEKYKLPFTLLADTQKSVVREYGVWAMKRFMGREYMGILRMSYLIDPKGKIAKIYNKVKPAEHASQVLDDLKLLIGDK